MYRINSLYHYLPEDQARTRNAAAAPPHKPPHRPLRRRHPHGPAEPIGDLITEKFPQLTRRKACMIASVTEGPKGN